MDENHLFESEVSPKEVLKYMKTNIYDNYFKNSHHFISSDYLLSRSSLFFLIRKISNKLGFKSQTFFLSIYYLDILFSKNKKIDCNAKILGLACLLLSSKYIENDPGVPNLATFIKVYNNAVGYKYIISVTDLFYAEVLTCKMLGYKLNYYTIYDFDSFFFGHGIIKMEQLRDINMENSNSQYKNFEINSTNSIFIRKILEKIYRKSRHYLELIVNNSNICLKYNSLIISIFIMKKSVEEILFDEQRINKHDLLNKEKFINKTSKCFKEIMKQLYQIDYESMEDYNELISDKDLIKLLQEERKTDFSPVLVDLENNLKFANDNSNNNRNSLDLKESQNTISSYSHINRFIPKYNISLNNNNLNTIQNGSKILPNVNLTRNSNNFSKYKNVYSHSSFGLSSNTNNKNISVSKKPIMTNYLDISNLSNSKELNKMELNNLNFNNERTKRALSRHSDLNQMKYVQRLTTYNFFTKKPNISKSISKNHNKSISIENDEDILDLIKSMENDNNYNKDKIINVESPVKFEKYNGYNNYNNYIRMNRLKKKPIKEINSYMKNKDYSISLIDNSNTLKSMNNVKNLEDENYNNYRKIDKSEIKPYFRKVIRNTANNNTINNFNSKNYNKYTSQRTSTSSYFSLNNNEGKRKHFNSLITNQFPLNINGKNKEKIYKISEPYLNTDTNDFNNNFDEINLYDNKDNNKYNANNNANDKIEKKEDNKKDNKIINSMKEEKISHNNIHNIKKKIFSKIMNENYENKNDKNDKSINDQDNN